MVYFQSRPLELRALAALSRKFGLFERGAQIGFITPKGLFTRSAVIDLPAELPPQLATFLFWLVVVMRRRRHRAHVPSV
jgi:hypothetical protein